MMSTATFYKRISQILIVFFINNLYVMLEVEGYSRGAPPRVCGSMMPGHYAEANDTTPPYDISVSSKTYSPNQKITVTIEGKSGLYFEGFLMVARRTEETESFGSFIPISGTQGLECSNKADSGITHSDNSTKTKLSFIWEAPATHEGDIRMTATIVKSKMTFWLNVTSEVVEPSFAPGTYQPPITTATLQANEINCKSKGKCQIRWLMDKAAGVTKFDFSLDSPTANMYIALGLSYDREMGADSVIACLRYPNGSILAQASYNTGSVNSLVPTDSITLTSTSFENGVMKCSFTRKNTVNNAKIYNLDGTEWYFLVAIGEVDMSKPTQKKYHTIRFASGNKIDLSKNEGLQNIEEDSNGILMSVHGSLMIFAWVFFASVGLFSARYSKSIDKKLKGLAIWFQLHRISMVSTLLLTVTGFIIIFAAEGEYSDSVGLPYDAHPVLGIIVTSLTLINPIMAFFRPDKDSSKRFWFNWAHRCVGVTAFILADATLFIGIFWYHRSMSAAKGSVTVMIIFIVYKCIAVITMELIDCCKERTTSSVELNTANGNTHVGVKVADLGKLKTILLICHVVVSGILSVLLVIFLNLKDDHSDHDH